MVYYIGLDMGTSSLGWAVTDEKYQLIRRKGKDMWGVRLFDEAQTAVERRTHRIARRRLQREKVRIGYLREYFSEAISAIDPGFYQRLEESKYYEEDKSVVQKNALFADKAFNDQDYFKEYPTIFHLRKELLESSKPHDPRLVYLAILNIFKHRGHFLNGTLEEGGIGNLSNLYIETRKMAEDLFGLHLNSECDWLEVVLASKEYSNSMKLSIIMEHENITKRNDKQVVEMWKLICGLTGVLSVLFTNDVFEDDVKKYSISFRDGNYDEKIAVVEELLSEESFVFLTLLKQIHDWGILANIMKGEGQTYPFLSFARVNAYEKHHQDLEILKDLYKKCGQEKYNKMFRVMEADNYSSYVGVVNYHDGVIRRGAKNNRANFYNRIKKEIATLPESDNKEYILKEIEKETLIPKQITNSNGVIPNQIHKAELRKILENAEYYLPFLKEKDNSGLSVTDRLLQLFSFQIPYYIGPISPYTEGKFDGSKNLWSVRKESGAVLPWNIHDKIDETRSAESFITKMVNHCTYLNGELVLPKNSLLYEKFMLLNEINNIRVNGEKISSELKQELYCALFRNGKKVTSKKIQGYLITNGLVDKDLEIEISGIDQDVTNRLVNYARFTSVFDVDILTFDQEKMAEQIIFWATLYGDTKKFLKSKIQDAYGDQLTKEQIRRITGFKFKDWGRLSKDLLYLEGADKETGEVKSVISRMWDENYNLMELLESQNFTYKNAILEKQTSLDKTLTEIQYEDLSELNLSTPVKRMVWQTMLVLKEIVGVMGTEPTKVFVEMAKDSNTKKVRTVSRKKKFIELYQTCNVDGINWSDQIANTEESEFRRKKLYLYYLQQGKCMYTGRNIELNDLLNDNLYDIDHIYPRHFVKDDNIDNNLVLVEKHKNAHKSDSFPIESNIQHKMHMFWKMLRDKNFISEEKYKRLTRTEEFTDDERVSFISRQIVETRQGTKTITVLLDNSFSHSRVVYVKAGNVSDFRHKYDFVKCRSVNDFHHANDAYLNIVVGNVYDTKFTQNPYIFVKEYHKDPKKNNYHMNRMFEYDVERNGSVAWESQHGESIHVVRTMMKKNTPLVTRMNYEAHGGFADQNIVGAAQVAKASGKGYIPIKNKNGKRLDTCKYGGYNKVTGAYFFLVEHENKGKTVRSLEAMPLYLANVLNSTQKLEKYCETALGYRKPTIKMNRIKMYSLLKVNGFYLYLTGRSNDTLLVCNAVQLVLNEDEKKYCKLLEKTDNIIDIPVGKIGITKEKNIQLYDVLMKKHAELIYSKRPNPVGDKLKNGRGTFIDLTEEKQVFVLKQILQLSRLTNQGANLTDIEGAKASGVATINKKISSFRECKLINLSTAGLYSNEIDLLTI